MVALVLLYFLLVDILPALAVRFVPVSEEIKMGDAFYKGLEQKQEMDAAASELVQDFADHLHLSQQYPIRVSVANSEEVNAYALPGGHIIVNRGILKILHSPESLAALLGHEATHINRRHSLKSMVSGMGTGLLISLVAGNGGGWFNF